MKKMGKIFAGLAIGVLACGFAACDLGALGSGAGNSNSNSPEVHECTAKETEIIEAPTCVMDGQGLEICECGASWSVTLKAFGHIEVLHEGKAATCVEKGWEPYSTCSREGCTVPVYKEELEIDPNNHTFVDGVCKDCKAAKLTFKFEKWDQDPRYYAITECVSYGEDEIVIPSTYTDQNGKVWNVKAVYGDIFQDCKAKKITISEGLESIGSFKGCVNLTDIIIPDSVTEIGSFMFTGCEKLTSITIGKGLKEWAHLVFEGGNVGVTNITVSEENKYLKSVDGNVYSKDGKTLLQYAIGKTDKTFTIPDGVTAVNKGAFHECVNLTGVVFPNTLETLDEYAFSNCKNLTDITFGSSLKVIKSHAFRSCNGLTSVVLPDSVEEIEYWVFSGCQELTSMTIGLGAKYIGAYMVQATPKLTGVIFKNPNGWKLGQYNGAEISADILSDPEKAMEYLRDVQNKEMVRIDATEDAE